MRFPQKHCSYCDKNGHLVSECWAREYDEEHGITNKQPRLSRGSSSSTTCEYCGSTRHSSHRCFKRRYDEDQNQAYATQQHPPDEDNVHQEANLVHCNVSLEKVLHVRDGSLFIVDSGATGNMTYQLQWLHNYHPIPIKKVVYLADDTTCQVMGIGDLYLGTLSSTKIL